MKLVILALAACASSACFAQGYPVKPIHLITQFAAGSTDLGLHGELATPPHQGGATVTFRTADIKALSVQLDLKLDKITDAVDTLQSGGKWLILLVVGAVVAAILELVIK